MNGTTNVALIRPRRELPLLRKIERLSEEEPADEDNRPDAAKKRDDEETSDDPVAKRGVDVLRLVQSILGDTSLEALSTASVEAAAKTYQETTELLQQKEAEVAAAKVDREIQAVEAKIQIKAAVKAEKAASRLVRSQAAEIQQLKAGLEAAEADNREKANVIEEQKAALEEKNTKIREKNEQIQELKEQQEKLQRKLDDIFDFQDETEASDISEMTTDLEKQLAELRANQLNSQMRNVNDLTYERKVSFNAKKPQRTRTDENLLELLASSSLSGKDEEDYATAMESSLEQELGSIKAAEKKDTALDNSTAHIGSISDLDLRASLEDEIADLKQQLAASNAKCFDHNIATYIGTIIDPDLLVSLEDEIAELKHRLAASNTKCLEDKTELQYLETMFTSELEETKESLFVAEDKVSALVGQLNDFKVKLAKAERKLAATEEDNWTLQEDGRKALKKSQEDVAELKKRLAASNAQCLDHARQLEVLEMDYAEQLAATTEQLELIKEQNSILLTRNAQFTANSTEQRDSSSVLSMSENSIAQLAKDNDQHNESNGSLTADDLTATKAEITERKSPSTAPQSDDKKQNDSVKLDHEDSYASLIDSDVIKEKLNQSEAKVSTLTEELRALQPLVSRVADLEKNLEEAQTKLKTSKQRSIESAEQLRKARAEQVHLKERLATLNAQRLEELHGLAIVQNPKSKQEPSKGADTTISTKADLDPSKAEPLVRTKLPTSSQSKLRSDKRENANQNLYDTNNLRANSSSPQQNNTKHTTRRVTELEKQLAEAQADLQKAVAENKALEDGYHGFLADALESMKRAEKEAAELKVSLEKAQAELELQSKLLDESNAKLAEKDRTLRSIASDAGVTEVSELSNKIASLQKRLIASSLDQVEVKIRNIESRCGVNDIHELPHKISDLEIRLSDAHAEKERAKGEMSELKKSLSQLKLQIENAKQDSVVASDKEELEELRSQISRTVSKKVALEEQIEILKEQRDKSEALVSALQAGKGNDSNSSGLAKTLVLENSGGCNLDGSSDSLCFSVPEKLGVNRPSFHSSFRQALSNSFGNLSARHISGPSDLGPDLSLESESKIIQRLKQRISELENENNAYALSLSAHKKELTMETIKDIDDDLT